MRLESDQAGDQSHSHPQCQAHTPVWKWQLHFCYCHNLKKDKRQGHLFTFLILTISKSVSWYLAFNIWFLVTNRSNEKTTRLQIRANGKSYLFFRHPPILQHDITPNSSPSSRVFGKCLFSVSGKNSAAMPPITDKLPIMIRGRTW